jgi:MFS family permease
MVTTLGASVAAVGLMEGVAESAVAFTKVFSGVLSDWLGKRKFLAMLGYGLAALTKPALPLASSVQWAFAAHLTDRIGKGIRAAPRDALVADITRRDRLGAAYGLRQALDTVGTFLGPLLAIVFMAAFAGNIRSVLWVAVIPAFLAVALLVFKVREPGMEDASSLRGAFRLSGIRRMPRRFWLVVLLGALFTLARFSEAFLVLRASDVGLSSGRVPLVMMAMSVAYAATAYPAGAATDRLGGGKLLVAGLVILVTADLVLAAATTPWHVLAGAGAWGVHMGCTQGLFNKLVAETTPAELRGTAFGIFNLVGGGALLLASVIAGTLWTAYGAPATFVAGAAFAALALLGLLLSRARNPRHRGGERVIRPTA